MTKTPADGGFAIITEFNRSVHGFLVHNVDRIINIPWEDVHTPPLNNNLANYMTAIAHFEQDLITIIDVERILQEFEATDSEVATPLKQDLPKLGQNRRVLIVDDSAVARQQIKRVLDQLGYSCLLAKTGKEALVMLENMAKESTIPVGESIPLIISDIEMPEMDGYSLTAEIRQNPQLKSLYVMLHTSLSGTFNQKMVAKVGANKFLAKFNPDDLAKAIIERFKEA
jgi:two-component system chemotaxis response regulator CheV